MIDEVNSEWYANRPNTDVAIMMGLAHTIVSQNLHNQSFLETHCVGFGTFSDYLLGKND